MAERQGQLPAGAELIADEAAVQQALDRMAGSLQPCIDGGDCVLLAVMMGGLLPAAWLMARLHGDYVLDYCHVTRYDGKQHGGQPEWLRPPRISLKGRTVLIVDDILDEGITLDYVRSACKEQGAAQVVAAVLVRKIERLRPECAPAEIIGMEVPNRYVFGCGMDLNRRWRHLPAIYALSESKT